MDRHALARLATLGELAHLLGLHAERVEPVAGGRLERRVARATRDQELVLRGHERRRVELEEELAPLDRIALGVDRQALDPARHARMDVGDAVLVERHAPQRAHGLGEALAAHRRGPHAEVVRERRRDAHAGRVPARGVLLVDGHQVHAHRGLAGAVAPIVRIHGRHPVERLALAVGALAAAARRCEQPDAGRAQGESEYRRRQDRGPSHRSPSATGTRNARRAPLSSVATRRRASSMRASSSASAARITSAKSLVSER